MKRSCLILVLMSACFEEQQDIGTGSTETGGTSSSSSTGTTTADATSTESSSTSLDPDTSSSTGEPASSEEDSSSSTGPEPITDWALYFDGSASAGSTDAVDLDLGPDFTVEAWIRTDSADTRGAIVAYQGVGTTGWSLSLEPVESNFVFGFFDNNGAWNEIVGPSAADLGVGWHHVAATKSGTSLRLHVDGSIAAIAECSSAVSAPTVPLLVGTDRDDANLIYSALDDVRVSSVARYQAGFTPATELEVDPSTVVLLVLDEGDGSASFDMGTAGILLDVQGATWTEGNT